MQAMTAAVLSEYQGRNSLRLVIPHGAGGHMGCAIAILNMPSIGDWETTWLA
jgi:hypothetical protein